MRIIELVQKNRHIKLAGNDKLRIERALPDARGPRADGARRAALARDAEGGRGGPRRASGRLSRRNDNPRMALHPALSRSPYDVLDPRQRWFPADEALRSTAYEKLLPPLVAQDPRRGLRRGASAGYAGASTTSIALLRWWFETEHLIEQADGSLDAVPLLLRAARSCRDGDLAVRRPQARDKFDLLRFDASGAVSPGMFDEDWPRYVVKMATGAGKTKVLSLLIAWSFFHKLYEPDSTLARNFLRDRAEHHRARSAARRLRRAAHLLQRSGAAGQRPRRAELARRLPAHAAHSGRRARRARRRATSS